MLGKRISLCLTVSSIALAALVHCSSDPPATNVDSTNDGGPNSNNNNNNNNSSDDGGGSADGNTPITPLPGECGIGKLCLDLDPALPAITNDYKIAVLWAQLNDDGPDPVPEQAYLADVSMTTKRIEILLSAVKVPTDEKNLLCDRATTDESVSPCLSDPKVGYGIVIAFEDTNGDGKYDSADKRVGSANAIFGFSGKAYAPGAMPATPYDWNRLWPGGIGEGVKIYQVDRPDGGTFDRPVPSTKPGTTNLLREKGPNLS